MFTDSHHTLIPSIWPSLKDNQNSKPSGSDLFAAMQWRAKSLSSCSRFRRFLVAGIALLGLSGTVPLPEMTSEAHAWTNPRTWRPFVHVHSNVQRLELGQKATITFSLSRAAYLVNKEKIQVFGGTLSPLVRNPYYKTYSATFTPHPDFKGTGYIHVYNGVFSDTRTGILNNDSYDRDNGVSFKINIDDGPTQQTIGSFLQNRMRLLTSALPDLTGFIDGSDVTLDGNGPASMSLDQSSGDYTFGLKTSLGKLWNGLNGNAQASLAPHRADQQGTSSHAADAIVSTTDASNIDALLDHPIDLPVSHNREYDMWMQVYGAGSNSGNDAHNLWAAYAGAHRHISENMLIGVMGQLDWADQANSVTGQTVEGTGWMVGPYMAARLPGQDVFLESRLAWGRSENSFRQSVSQGAFDTTRLLLSGKLSGVYDSGNDFLVRPTIGLNYFKEKQAGFRDNLGNTIAGQTISMGELNFGSTYSRYTMLENGDMLEASFGTTGVWNFDLDTQGAPAAFTGLGSDSVRGRLDFGLERKSLKGKTVGLKGFYDGIGASDYEAFGGKVSLTMPIY